MTLAIKAGTANVSVTIRIIDSTDGTPETGVTSATGGLALEYRREGAVSTAITESDLSALTDAHSDGGMKHIGNGYYRLDLPDAACATGVTGVLVHGTATGMVVVGEYIQLVTYDPFDSVRLGLTALPNAAADAAGGLPISDAGGLDLDGMNTNVSSILTDTGTTLDNHLTDIKGTGFVKDTHSLVNIEGYVDLIDDGTSGLAKIATDVAAVLVDTAEIGVAGAGLTAIPWNASWDAEVQSECNDALVALNLDHLLGAAVVGTDVVDNSVIAKMVSASATADWDDFVNTTESLQALRDRGDSAWITATGFSTHAAADVWSVATRVLTAATNITSDDSKITASSGAVTVGTNNDKTGYALTSAYDFAKGTTAMTEAYNSDGSAPTPVQALMLTLQSVSEFAISGTTKTVKKLDGSTTAATFTLDDASSPTSITRAT